MKSPYRLNRRARKRVKMMVRQHRMWGDITLAEYFVWLTRQSHTRTIRLMRISL